jgi:hypothetical protein
MSLQQLQVTYHQQQDRVLLRAAFKGPDEPRQELRAWITRRMVPPLWSGMLRALSTQISLELPQSAQASREIIGMKHEASVAEQAARGNFNDGFDNSAQEYPMGEEPLLIDALRFTVNPHEPVRINFAPPDGKGFEIAFSSAVLHAFCKLLQDAVKSAQWNLTLVMPAPAPAPRSRKRVS